MADRNINYTYMTNLWGNINYKQINNFNEWYMGDFGSAYYYQDWDKILRYFAGAGFKGIEIMVFSVPSITQCLWLDEKFQRVCSGEGD